MSTEKLMNINDESNESAHSQFMPISEYKIGTIVANMEAIPTQTKDVGTFYRLYLQSVGIPDTNEALFQLKPSKCQVKGFPRKDNPTSIDYRLSVQIEDQGDIQGLGILSSDIIKLVTLKKTSLNLTINQIPGITIQTQIEMLLSKFPILKYQLDKEKNVPLPNTKPKMSLSFDKKTSFDMEDPDNPGCTIQVPYEKLDGMQFDAVIVFNVKNIFSNQTMTTTQLFVRECLLLSDPVGASRINIVNTPLANYLTRFKDNESAADLSRKTLENLKKREIKKPGQSPLMAQQQNNMNPYQMAQGPANMNPYSGMIPGMNNGIIPNGLNNMNNISIPTQHTGLPGLGQSSFGQSSVFHQMNSSGPSMAHNLPGQNFNQNADLHQTQNLPGQTQNLPGQTQNLPGQSQQSQSYGQNTGLHQLTLPSTQTQNMNGQNQQMMQNQLPGSNINGQNQQMMQNQLPGSNLSNQSGGYSVHQMPQNFSTPTNYQ